MTMINEYLEDISTLWEQGERFEAFLKLLIPLVILSALFWLTIEIVNIIFGLIIPVLIILFLVAYFSKS